MDFSQNVSEGVANVTHVIGVFVYKTVFWFFSFGTFCLISNNQELKSLFTVSFMCLTLHVRHICALELTSCVKHSLTFSIHFILVCSGNTGKCTLNGWPVHRRGSHTSPHLGQFIINPRGNPECAKRNTDDNPRLRIKPGFLVLEMLNTQQL